MMQPKRIKLSVESPLTVAALAGRSYPKVAALSHVGRSISDFLDSFMRL